MCEILHLMNCDLKNLKKLISGSCPTPIIQSYINNLTTKYMSMIYTKCTVVCIFFLLIYFAIYNYLLLFESDHIWFQHHFIHMCVHPSFFFTVLKNWKTKNALLKRCWCVGCVFFRHFWMCIFYPTDFSLSCFEVFVRFSKCKF